MSIDTDIFSRKGAADVSTDEQARAAVKVFRALQPTLSAYARNLTGRKDVSVEMATHNNGATDGKKIYYRPPIALGQNIKHTRSLCDKRGDDKLMLCPACAAREEVLVTIYHEIAHLAFDSFAEVTVEDFQLTMRKAIEEVGTKYARKIEAALDAAPYHVKRSYIGISNFVSPYLPFLVNCIEDARVNDEMFRARPGTKVMFDASTEKIFREGVEQVDKMTGQIKVVPWREYPLNAQVTLGVFCLASRYDTTDWFHPLVEAALLDEELNRLARQVDTIRSASGVYQLAFPILARLRELGFCKSDRDPEDEPEDETPDNDDSVEEEPPSGEDSDDETESESSSDESGEEGSSGGEGEEDGPEAPAEEAGAEESDDDLAGGDGGDAGDEAGGGSEEDEGEGSDSADDPGAGGSGDDREEERSDPADGGAPDPDGNSGDAAADESDAGDASSEEDGDEHPDAGEAPAGEEDAGPASGDGAEADTSGSELDSDDEGGVDGEESSEGTGSPDSEADAGDSAGTEAGSGASEDAAELGDSGDGDRDGGSGGGGEGDAAEPDSGDESADGESTGASDQVGGSEAGDAGDGAGGEVAPDRGDSGHESADSAGHDSGGGGDESDVRPGDEGGPGDSDSEEASEDSDGDEAGLTGTGSIEGDTAGGEPEEDADRGGSNREGSGAADDSRGVEDGADGTADSLDGLVQEEREPETRTGEPGGEGNDTDESDDPRSAQASEEDEPIDTGADDGTGGAQVIEDEALDDVPFGEPEDVKVGLAKLGDHEEKPETVQEKEEQDAVDRAIIQGFYFETPSRKIWGVREHYYGQPVIVDGYNTSQGWDTGGTAYTAMGFSRRQIGRDTDLDIPESVLGPALVRMRVAFSDNKRGKNERNLKSGKVNTRALGKRAWSGDDRLFKKRTQPGKKDYFVVIGMDISGSTVGENIALEKRAVMAQAELCDRMGIKFAVYAHSGNLHAPAAGRRGGFDLDVYHVKDPKEPWSDEVQQRLADIGPDSVNLDGHFLEYLRNRCDEDSATHKVIMYYSDGKMPAENYDEELEILQREIRYCHQRKYALLGVGIRTDSPARHGLDTAQVEEDEDIVKVVKHLERKLEAL